nr:copper homeostasis protein CutC [Elizabethkingia argenteiflava]
MTTLEIACFNEPSARIAAYGGVDRIELCENYAEGGLTPQAETLRRLKTHVRIPIFVMIRPRGGNFQYTKCEFKEMQTQLLDLKSLGADGFVFGILSSEGKVDIEKNKVLVQLAGGRSVHFILDLIRYTTKVKL